MELTGDQVLKMKIIFCLVTYFSAMNDDVATIFAKKSLKVQYRNIAITISLSGAVHKWCKKCIALTAPLVPCLFKDLYFQLVSAHSVESVACLHEVPIFKRKKPTIL